MTNLIGWLIVGTSLLLGLADHWMAQQSDPPAAIAPLDPAVRQMAGC